MGKSGQLLRSKDHTLRSNVRDYNYFDIGVNSFRRKLEMFVIWATEYTRAFHLKICSIRIVVHETTKSRCRQSCPAFYVYTQAILSPVQRFAIKIECCVRSPWSNGVKAFLHFALRFGVRTNGFTILETAEKVREELSLKIVVENFTQSKFDCRNNSLG